MPPEIREYTEKRKYNLKERQYGNDMIQSSQLCNADNAQFPMLNDFLMHISTKGTLSFKTFNTRELFLAYYAYVSSVSSKREMQDKLAESLNVKKFNSFKQVIGRQLEKSGIDYKLTKPQNTPNYTFEIEGIT